MNESFVNRFQGSGRPTASPTDRADQWTDPGPDPSPFEIRGRIVDVTRCSSCALQAVRAAGKPSADELSLLSAKLLNQAKSKILTAYHAVAIIPHMSRP